MRVGMDAIALGHPPSGLQQHARNLLEGMLAVDPAVRFSLGYVGLSEGLRRFAGLGSQRVRIHALPIPAFAARFRDVLDYAIGGLLVGPVDTWFAPHFHLPPLTLAKRRVLLVPDLAMHVHPEHFVRSNRWFMRKLRWSIALADAVVTSTEATRGELCRYLGVPPDKVHVIPCACHDRYRVPLAEDERQAVLASHGLTFPYLLSVGTLQPRKNFERLMDAFSLLADDPVHLVIVGARGWNDDGILARARSADVAPRVHLLTDVDDADLPAVYQGARAFCFPSVYEGFGIPLLEAMASGIPVASSNASCLPEVVGDAALLFDPLDRDDMAEAMRRVLTDEVLRARLVDAGRVRAEQFTWTASGRALLAVLRGGCS